MRADSLVATLTTFLFAVVSVALIAQDDPTAVEVARRAQVLNDIKLMAQQAALPSLRGEEKFTLRESWWKGSIAPGKAKLIQVQLFQRNSYQFWLATPNPSAEMLLNVYNSDGQLVPSDRVEHEGSNVVSTVVEPDTTGVYYVRVSLKTSIEDAQDWAVIYAYR